MAAGVYPSKSSHPQLDKITLGVVVDAMVRLEDGEAALVGAVDRLLLNAPNHLIQRPDPSGTSLA